MAPQIELCEVTSGNWRAVAELELADAQRGFAGPVTRYLCLCHYGGVWHPLAVCSGDQTVGFVMWAIDPDDRSGWIGGLVIDRRRQREGFGRATVQALAARLAADGCGSVALSYLPGNSVARALYLSLGFEETGEMEDDEVVARRRHPAP